MLGVLTGSGDEAARERRADALAGPHAPGAPGLVVDVEAAAVDVWVNLTEDLPRCSYHVAFDEEAAP